MIQVGGDLNQAFSFKQLYYIRGFLSSSGGAFYAPYREARMTSPYFLGKTNSTGPNLAALSLRSGFIANLAIGRNISEAALTMNGIAIYGGIWGNRRRSIWLAPVLRSSCYERTIVLSFFPLPGCVGRTRSGVRSRPAAGGKLRRTLVAQRSVAATVIVLQPPSRRHVSCRHDRREQFRI